MKRLWINPEKGEYRDIGGCHECVSTQTGTHAFTCPFQGRSGWDYEVFTFCPLENAPEPKYDKIIAAAKEFARNVPDLGFTPEQAARAIVKYLEDKK